MSFTKFMTKKKDQIRTIDDHNPLGGFLLAELVEDQVDCLTKHNTVGIAATGTFVDDRIGGRFDVVQDVCSKVIWVTASLEVVDGSLDGYNIVAVSRSLNIGDTRSHQSFAND